MRETWNFVQPTLAVVGLLSVTMFGGLVVFAFSDKIRRRINARSRP